MSSVGDEQELLEKFIVETKKFCRSSSGRGRLSFQQGRHLFTYDAHFYVNRNAWRFAVFFPLQPELPMLITWDEDSDSSAQLRGPMALRLENELRVEGRERWARQWEDFQQGVGSFIRALEAPEKKCRAAVQGLECDENLKISYGPGQWLLKREFEDSYFFEAILQEDRLSLKLDHAQRRAEEGAILGLELFIRECL